MLIFDIINAVRALEAIQTATAEQLVQAGGSVADEMEQYAKANAPWCDRTGNARRTLEGFCGAEGTKYTIGVCGNMPYSPKLETGFQGRYAILVPTLDTYTPRMIELVRGAVASNGGINA